MPPALPQHRPAGFQRSFSPTTLLQVPVPTRGSCTECRHRPTCSRHPSVSSRRRPARCFRRSQRCAVCRNGRGERARFGWTRRAAPQVTASTTSTCTVSCRTGQARGTDPSGSAAKRPPPLKVLPREDSAARSSRRQRARGGPGCRSWDFRRARARGRISRETCSSFRFGRGSGGRGGPVPASGRRAPERRGRRFPDCRCGRAGATRRCRWLVGWSRGPLLEGHGYCR